MERSVSVPILMVDIGAAVYEEGCHFISVVLTGNKERSVPVPILLVDIGAAVQEESCFCARVDSDSFVECGVSCSRSVELELEKLEYLHLESSFVLNQSKRVT